MKQSHIILSILLLLFLVSCNNEELDDFNFIEDVSEEIDNEDTTDDQEVSDDPNTGDDNDSNDDQEEENQDEENQDEDDTDQDFFLEEFVTPEGDIYYTGTTDCTSTGEYVIDPNKVLESLTISDDLPEEQDLSSYLPPVDTQGQQGSCASWATTYYLKSFQERIAAETTGINESIVFSPSYTYNQITQGICEGTSYESNLEILKNKGAISLGLFPYQDNTCSIQPTDAEDQIAQDYKILDYFYLSGNNMVLEMKELIYTQKPILIAAFLTSDFGEIDDFGLTAYREHIVDYSVPGACHGMLVVGYSDQYNAFKVVNSWGQDWGDAGFVWIDYAAFENVSNPSSTFRVISQAIVVEDL
ncbi:papain family cysteine protease [Dokdonia sp. MED134]|uniref:C1 family peptidase n=1 Tax=Dokdonia sp. MED134 TaxID=313590 RepID=UPI0000689BDF|nr:C1 family peptidase [Dokdonia sp. MED134]EAQ38420.1 papain family cysteine protease [Dokdonia sp. MED134]